MSAEKEALEQLDRDFAEGRLSAERYAAARRDLLSVKPSTGPSSALLVVGVLIGIVLTIRGLAWMVEGSEGSPSPLWLLAGIAVLAGTAAYNRHASR